MGEVTVAVATFGSEWWMDLAKKRAIPSAQSLGGPVVYRHGATLHDARNDALAMVETEFVCFLDADDELEVGFFDEIGNVSADLRVPAVRYVRNRHAGEAKIPRVAGHQHDCMAECLTYGNWLVVGTVARTELLRKVGGWRDFPLYEDWDMWVRCWQAGASIAPVPSAVYRAHVRSDSRNRAPKRDLKMNAHRLIARANSLPVPA